MHKQWHWKDIGEIWYREAAVYWLLFPKEHYYFGFFHQGEYQIYSILDKSILSFMLFTVKNTRDIPAL